MYKIWARAGSSWCGASSSFAWKCCCSLFAWHQTLQTAILCWWRNTSIWFSLIFSWLFILLWRFKKEFFCYTTFEKFTLDYSQKWFWENYFWLFRKGLKRSGSNPRKISFLICPLSNNVVCERCSSGRSCLLQRWKHFERGNLTLILYCVGGVRKGSIIFCRSLTKVKFSTDQVRLH